MNALSAGDKRVCGTVCLALIILTHAFFSLYLQEEVMTAVVVEFATRGKYTVYVLDVHIHVHGNTCA